MISGTVVFLQPLGGALIMGGALNRQITVGGGGRGKNSGRGSVENTIFRQRGSASCELSGRYPLVYNYFSKG